MSAQTFGELVRSHREAAGLTQLGLAQTAGVSMMGVSYLETGRIRDPRVSTVARLSKALGVEPGALLQPFTRDNP